MTGKIKIIFVKCRNGYSHPETSNLTEGKKCNECNEINCMFRSEDAN